MSIGGSLSGITFGGLSSGIDTDSLINRLIQVEAFPIQRLKLQQATLNSRSSVLQQLKGQLSTFSTNAAGLNSLAAFNPIKATSSDTAVATISATSSAVAGTYNLSVSKLAQAHKIASGAQTNATDALNLSGQFVVNGKALSVVATDSLTAIAQKINNLNVGVTGSIINGGAGNAFLTLTASNSGATNKIQITDVVGGVAGSIGLTTSPVAIRETIPNGATSYGFSSNSTAIGSLLGATGLSPSTIQIDGNDVILDLGTDTLQDVADKFNAVVPGSALVRSVEQNGKTVYKLDLTGGTTPTFVDSDNTLAALGILQPAFGSELVVAQSAQYVLDNIALTSESNSVTSVIPGVTLTLLSADAGTPKTSTLSLTRDTEAVKSSVQGFVDAFNGVGEFIKQNSKFDKDTFASGVLFGDPVARQVESGLSDLLFANVAGLSGPYTNLAQLGFTMAEEGTLKFDQSVFDAAMAADPTAVANVFRSVGAGSVESIVYISASDKTRSSGVGSYDVAITQVATKGNALGSIVQSGPSVDLETLTFNGPLFGSTPYQLVLPIGSTVGDTVGRINADSKLKDLVVADVDPGGLLRITSKKYGANGSLTVDSDLVAGIDNSGIGTTGISNLGLDVAGTIGGEAATGNGQFLLGNSGNASTDGLQIQYTGVDTGLIGTLKFTKGIGALMTDTVFSYTDSVAGLLSSTDTAIQDQVSSIEKAISDIEERLVRRESELRQRFARMEQTIATYQAQGSRLGALTAG